MAHSDCGWTCGCVGKTVKSLENTCHNWALLWWWFTTKRRYIKCMHLYLSLPLWNRWKCLKKKWNSFGRLWPTCNSIKSLPSHADRLSFRMRRVVENVPSTDTDAEDMG